MRLLLDPAVKTEPTAGAAATTLVPPAAGQTASSSAAAGATQTTLLGEKLATTTEQKPATVSTETKPAASTIPDKYDLKMPDKSLLGASYADKIAAIAKQQGLSNAQAQAMMEHASGTVKEYVDAQVQEYQKGLDQQRAQWIDTLKKHPTLGGEKLKENDELATRFLQRFGGDAVVKILQDTHYAYHPAVFEMLAKAGRAMQTQTETVPGAARGAQMSREEALLEFFPSMKPKPQGQTA